MITHIALIVILFNANPDAAPDSIQTINNECDHYKNFKANNIVNQFKQKKFDKTYLRSGILFWDFEGSYGGFTCTPIWDAWLWVYWTTYYSETNVWATYGMEGHYEDYADWRLESPWIVLDPAGACTLSFFHWYMIEYFYDGGNLKVSNDSGLTWSIIYPFEPSGYPCDSASSWNWGIPGEPCFSGDSSSMGWHQAKFLLDDYAGQEVMIRWHFGSDGAAIYPGWYIDDVRITNVESAGGIICDAGPTGIILPDINILPNLTINPQVSYRNFGWENESIDVYLKIDTVGINIYNESLNMILEPYAETTVTFSPWTTCSGENIICDVIAYTVLDGDQYPLNDTLTQQTTVSSHFWELLPAPFPIPSSGHSLMSKDDSTYMVMGIHIPGIYLDTTLIYDIATDTWIGGSKNPYGPASYGTANVVNGKFYRIAGTNDFPDPLNRVDIYDPASNIWSSGVSSPVGLIDHISGVYNDSLIFTFGNGNWDYPPTNYVSFYNVYTNSWTTVTPFPEQGRGACAGGIIDSFAIIACGFKADGTFCKDYIIGIINPSNPASIAWGMWNTIPGMADGRYRVPCGIDKWNKELWLVCGKITGGETDETWSFNPHTMTWTNWNNPKPHPMSNVTPIVITYTIYGNTGIFVPSGYHSNSYISEHEFFHTGALGIEEWQKVKESVNFGFHGNIPNPSKSYTPISYMTTKSGRVSLKVYDKTGRLIRILVDRQVEPPGEKTVYWDGKDNNLRKVASGIYFLRLVAENNIDTYKLVLIH